MKRARKSKSVTETVQRAANLGAPIVTFYGAVSAAQVAEIEALGHDVNVRGNGVIVLIRKASVD